MALFTGNSGSNQNSPENLTEKLKEQALTPQDKRTDLALEMRKKKSEETLHEKMREEMLGADTETGKKILKLNPEIEAAEQMPEWNAMEIVGATLFAKIFASGIDADDLASPSDLFALELDEKLMAKLEKNLNQTEKIALQKLLQIARVPQSKLGIYLQGKWKGLMANFVANYERARQAEAALSGKKERKGNAMWEWIKENKKMTAGLLLLGGLGIGYAVLSGDDEKLAADDADDTEKDPDKEKKEKKKSWFGKIWKWLAAALSIFTLGGLVSSEKARDFIKSLWDETIGGGAGESPEHKDLAQKLSAEIGKTISPSTIKKLAKVKYKDFSSVRGNAEEMMEAKVMEKVREKMPDMLKGLLGNGEKESAETKIVRDYLFKNYDKIKALNLPEDATVADVLAKLTASASEKAAVVGATVAPGSTENAPENPDQGGDIDAIETSDNSLVAISKSAYKNFTETFPDKTNTRMLFEKYSTDPSKMLDVGQFSKDLLSACAADGLYVVVGAGKVLIEDGAGKLVVLSTWNALADSVSALAQAPFRDDIGIVDAAEAYAEGAMSFVIIGALYGGLSAPKMKIVNGELREIRFARIRGALKGAGKGLIFPVTVTKAGVRAGQKIYRTAKGAEFRVHNLVAKEAARPQILANEAKFYAELASKYDRTIQGAVGASGLKEKLRSKIFDVKRATTLRDEYVKKFIRAYNEHLDITKSAQPRLKADNEEMLTEARKTMDEFLRKQGVDPAKSFVENGQANEKPEAKLSEDEIKAREKYYSPEEVPGKKNTFRFMGQEVVLTEVEIGAKITEIQKTASASISSTELRNNAIKSICEEKMLHKIVISETRKNAKGITEYKIGNEWVAAEIDASNPATKAKFIEALKEKGITNFNFESFAKTAKVMKFFNILEKVAGPTTAALVIYHLETTPDAEKPKAVAEVAAGFGTFFAGMKLADWQIGSKIVPNTPTKMVMRTVVDLMGGIAASYGLTEPIGEIIHHFYKDTPGAFGTSEEIISIFEKTTTFGMARMAIHSAEKGVLKTAINKAGLHGIEKFFASKVENNFLKKIAKIGASKGLRRILIAAGPKAAVAAGLWADDATVIGVIDDLLAIPLTLWVAKDVYDIAILIKDSLKVKEEMDKRAGKPLESFKIKDRESQAKFLQELQKNNPGATLDNLEQMGEENLFALLSSLPKTTIEIKRAGIPGREVWVLEKGEAVAITIQDASGKTLAQVTEEDAKSVDKALQEMDRESPSAAA